MDLNTGSDELSVVGDTAVDAPDPARLDITVTVAWQVTRNSVYAFRGRQPSCEHDDLHTNIADSDL